MSEFEGLSRELPGGDIEIELFGRRFVLSREFPVMDPGHPEWERFREVTDADPWMRRMNDELELEAD